MAMRIVWLRKKACRSRGLFNVDFVVVSIEEMKLGTGPDTTQGRKENSRILDNISRSARLDLQLQHCQRLIPRKLQVVSMLKLGRAPLVEQRFATKLVAGT